jgi:hypothetical protein
VIAAANVHTELPDRTRCAGTCASIVFMAGREHVVKPGGLLGLQACLHPRTRRPDEACNERIAQHALEHGTAHGSVMAFLQSEEPVWLDADQAHCWGLNHHGESPSPPGHSACVFRVITETLRQAPAAPAPKSR